MAEQWLSIVEYARAFAVSDMTVRRRIKTGRLQAVLKEGKYYIPVGPGSLQPLSEPLESQPETKKPPELIEPTKMAAVAGQSQDECSFTNFQPIRPGASMRTLPNKISTSLQQYDNTLVDSQALLQFCEHSMTRINSIERHLQESFQLRIQSLEAQLRLKDSQLDQLRQQVEDFQMLVKLMEQK
ncbi:MAG: hypothetical protein NTX25_06870 [Proteobacteria bacterium]|nr:hypothetical protein [Pseudomonadota bacterium]